MPNAMSAAGYAQAWIDPKLYETVKKRAEKESRTITAQLNLELEKGLLYEENIAAEVEREISSRRGRGKRE